MPPQLTADRAEQTVICLINKRRAHFHLRNLHASSQLAAAAEDHSVSMHTLHYFSHDSSSDGSPVSRISSTGYMSGASSWMVGENLRWGTGSFASPKSAVAAWMASAEHRHVMLDGTFREVGIGVVPGSPLAAQENDAAIYTADFGFRR
jgi:uncharacterized protein YkwD